MYIQRYVNLLDLLANHSYFLFGPRLTGKSKLIDHDLAQDAFVINLLKSQTYLQLAQHPDYLEKMIKAQNKKIIVIDEVQRLPILLHDVHALIEEGEYRFLLTGSSGKALKKSGTNLLAGRARIAHLYPLTSFELKERFDLNRYLLYGGLPKIYLSDEPDEDLFVYTSTYLKEEIQAEAFVRKIPSFLKFLEMAALSNGHILNFANLASDIGLSVSTVREYYFILEDTFLGFMVEPFKHLNKRKSIATAKFYFFDLGVTRSLSGIQFLDKKTAQYGQALEHFIAIELRSYLSYKKYREKLYFFRTTSHDEVDFIIPQKCAIEIKATEEVKAKHLEGLKVLAQEEVLQKYYLISLDPIAKVIDNIVCLPIEEFLKRLWNDEIF